MAKYSNLPVFKACYDLLLYVMNWSVKVQRDMRYTIAEDLKKSLIGVEIDIYRANKSVGKEKLRHIREGRERFVESMIYLRILNDMHQISQDQYAHTALLAGEVDKHLTNWEKSCEMEKSGEPSGRPE